jgi:hypothetical protein
MPAKKHGKVKARYSKKSKAILRQGAAPVQAAASPGASGGQAPSPAAPAARPAVPASKAIINEYPYVAGELARIGVLAVIIIAVLIVLSIVLK